MQSVGMPSAYMEVSETRATSAFSFAGILGHVFRDGGAAHFLFAFHQEFHVHRQRAIHRTQGFDGLDVHVHLALVVHRAAGVEVAVALGGLEGGVTHNSRGSAGCTS